MLGFADDLMVRFGLKTAGRAVRPSNNTLTMLLDQLREFLSSYKGMVSVEEGLALCRYATSCAGGDIVEIGSSCGKSAVALAEGALRSGVQVFCIDPHTELTGVLGGKFGPKDRG